MAEPSLAVVTVSWSGRTDFLLRQGERLAADPALRKWIVVANGNGSLLRAALPKLPLAPRLVELGANAGSAQGFAAGMTAALADPGNRHLLLLDEDNLPAEGSITGLLGLAGDDPSVAVAAYRQRLHWAEARGIATRRPDSSFGFHLFDLPAKLWRRLFGAPQVRARAELPSAPYGGLLFQRGLIEMIGLPDPQLVLYADDTEWTLRLTAGGGRILLATDHVVSDMDRPAAAAAPGLFSVRRWLAIDEDFRLYYGARNEAWLDTHRLRRNRAIHAMNRAIVLLVLRLAGRGRKERLALFRAAIAAGEAGRLGPEPRFPLPEAA